MMERQWYVALTRPFSDRLATGALEAAGIEVYSPKIKAPHRRLGENLVPLFPGYMFVRCNLQDDMSAIRQSPLLRGLLHFGGLPPAVPDEVVENVAQRVEEVNQQGGLRARFKPGDRVSVAIGSTEALGEVIQANLPPQARVSVLIEFMGRLVRAQVPWQSLHPVSKTMQWATSVKAPRRTRGHGRWIKGFEARAPAQAH